MSSFVRIDASLSSTLRLTASATSHVTNGRVVTTAHQVSARHRVPTRSPSPGSSAEGELILQFSAEDLELNSRQPRVPSGMAYQSTVPNVNPIQPAPAVVAGTPLDQLDVYRASINEQVRFQLHRLNPAAVPAQEVAQATLRTAAIIQQHLTVRYPQQAPQWAIDLEQRLQQQIQQLGDRIDQSEQRSQQSEQRSQQQLTRIEATLHDTRAAAFNARASRNYADGSRARNFRRFVKLTPGLGRRLPHARAPRHRIPLLEVGDIVPRRFFPETPAVLGRWSHGSINDLSILLNDDFGIRRTDRLGERRRKVLLYLTTA